METASVRPVSRRGDKPIMRSESYPDSSEMSIQARPTTSMSRTSTRPPSALNGGTATRLSSAMRVTTASSGQQRTGTAMGFANNVISERLLTQHGLSGLPTAQARVGTAIGARHIKDTRYWQAQLQLKMDEIRKETERLTKEKLNIDREKSAKNTFEKKVKETTKELTVLQGKLSDMNIALDAANSNVSRQQMQQESLALRERNEHLQARLESTFTDRQAKEAKNKQLEAEIEQERNKISEIINAMSVDDQAKYRQLEESIQKFNAETTKYHEQIAGLLNQKASMETVVQTSSDRMEMVRLLAILQEQQQKLAKSKEDERRRLTPAQEREKLINEVRENKQALTSIQHQIKFSEETLNEKKELLQQIENDLEEGSLDRYSKYKELKRRDETMSEFMDTFKEKFEEEKRKIDVVKNQITSAIEQMTMQGVNLKSLDISRAALLNEKNDLSSEDGLLKEYKRLSIQLKQLQIIEKRSQNQIETLKKDEITSLADIERFGNLDALREEAARRLEELQSNLSDAKHKKRVTENVVEESQHRNEELKNQLKSNDNYRQISHLEEKLNDLMEDNKEMQETFDQMRKEFDFLGSKSDAEEKLRELLQLIRNDKSPVIV